MSLIQILVYTKATKQDMQDRKQQDMKAHAST